VAGRTRQTVPSIPPQVDEHGNIGGPYDGRYRYVTTHHQVSALDGSDDRDGRVGRRGGPATCAEGGRLHGRGRQRGHRSRCGLTPAVQHYRRRAVWRRVQH